MSITRLADHTDPVTGETDWDSYKRAQVANGESCYQCDACIAFESGHKALCVPCENLRDRKEATIHERRVRCPKCKTLHEPYDISESIFESGEHNVTCSNCGSDFVVTTVVTYAFESPAVEEATTEYIRVGAFKREHGI